ncbi:MULTISPECIES: SDR family NAD(P)-dependent oxidoreductase [unclassified Nocardioides]|uniref:SDR family NAD(P)-dependent oxidoreductase n=1 Tax=unclassified Nocardioides TaxID=2615069 RepID=UPI0011504248|nr:MULTISPECIES: SDR family oxidoreductase [unclassified Nocardioides]TQK69006.1 NAD(P)-dependent dehydrogenase (short-subunit alcohol dehydrogenase family) [Nocardioides sp. SLBN-35]WGY01761.1 SDR family oxidoreductase [Nocardioides sp. QY071]
MTNDTINLGFTPGDAVIVTGAGSGIGRAVALGALDAGLRVSGWDLRPDGLEDLAAKGVHTAVCDVADASARADALSATTAALGGVPRYLVNNAGPSSQVPLDFEEAVRISVGSVRGLTQDWLDAGTPTGSAMVVTASVAGNRVGTESDWYSASKAAVMGYVRHLAAHKADLIRANGIGPGMTDTPRLAGFAQSEMGHHILGRVPLKRMGRPEEMAWPILFLLSPLASYVNGVFLPVDGGWTITQ